jgi:hypothetical protein
MHPVIRVIARSEFPSTKAETTALRSSVLNLFMPEICLIGQARLTKKMKKVLTVVCSNRHKRLPRSRKNMAEPLAEERKFFSEHQDEWKRLHAEKFVLVKGQELIGTFNRPEDALAEGARRFGEQPFLVRHVNHDEKNLYIPALVLGILNARSTQPV